MKILFLIVCVHFVYNQETLEQFYKHLVFRETPYSEVKGRIPISREEAMQENHYKLTYRDGRLVLVEYRFGTSLISRSRVGIMDGFRNLESRTVITYEGNKEIRTFFNVENKQVTNPMSVYKEVYEYNNKGERVSLKHYNKFGKPTNSAWIIHEYIWKKNSDGSVLEKRKNSRGEFVTMRPYYEFKTTLYKFHNDGLLHSMNNVNGEGELVNDPSGIAVDRAIYDDNKNLVRFNFYDENNTPVLGSFLHSAGGKIEYDKDGNCVKYSTIDLDGNLMMEARNRAYSKYSFDSYGNITERVTYGLDHKPVNIFGFKKIKYVYDTENPAIQIKTEHYH